MMRWMCRAKIHRATVTDCCLDYEGSLELDARLIEAAGFLPNEMIQVLNLSNGQRFETYAIAGPKGSGMICLNGAAARMGVVKDKVIIISAAMVDESEVPSFSPKVVFVNDNNKKVHKK